jgi:hypothetical protein
LNDDRRADYGFDAPSIALGLGAAAGVSFALAAEALSAGIGFCAK